MKQHQKTQKNIEKPKKYWKTLKNMNEHEET